MATQDSTLGQQIRAKFQEMNKAEDEKLRIAYEQRMSNTLDISVDAAKQLTELIKGKMVGILDQILEVDQLLLEAHDRGAWRVLGYGTWQEYMKKEFDLSRSRSYQLLDRARVRQALLAAGVEAVAPADPSKPDSPLISRWREIKPSLHLQG